MTSTWGKILQLSIFGQSHGQAVGMVLDGLPAGLPLDLPRLDAFMQTRAPGLTAWSSPRREADTPLILSGLVNGLTCGAPLAALIENTDAHSADYASEKRIPRPGHADFTAWARYGQAVDLRGGGHFSGRLTAPLTLAGGICLQVLEKQNIYVDAHILSIDGITGADMEARILAAKEEGDSVGGVVECTATGLPPGIGDPMFEGIENRLAAALFAIPGLKGVEFGAGFAAATMRGSQHNDAFIVENGHIRTATNHHGGVLGGISSGMPVIFRVAFKPTPSIAQEQISVDMDSMQPVKLRIQGRHDPTIVPRAVPVVEAVTALVLLDMLLERKAEAWN